MLSSVHRAASRHGFCALRLGLLVALCAPWAVVAKPPPPGSYYVVRHSGNSPITMHVVDADAPSVPLLSVDLPAEIYTPIAALAPNGPGANAVLGYPLLTYVKEGSLYKVVLTKPGTPVPIQLSSLTTVCTVAARYHVLSDASDNLIETIEAGPDGNCATSADNRRALVHTTDTSATPPVYLPAGVSLLAPLRDMRGNLIWSLAREVTGADTKLVLISPAGVPAGDVVGGAGPFGAAFLLGSDDTSSQAAYMKVDTTLRRITWNAAGAALSGSLFALGSTGVWMLSDLAGAYFAHGFDVYRVAGAGTPTLLTQLKSDDGPIVNYAQTPTHLVFQQYDATRQRAGLVSVNKSTGTKVAIAPPRKKTQIAFPSVQGEKVAYFLRRLKAEPGSYDEELRSVMTDGSGDTLVEARLFGLGSLLNRVLSPAIGLSNDAMIYCKPASGDADCRRGKLVQWAIAKGKTTTLGSFSGDPSLKTFAPASAGGWNPLPFGMRVYATRGEASTFESWTDMFTAKPGEAGSLGRVTNQIP